MKEKIHLIDCGGNIGLCIEWALKTYGEHLVQIDSFEPYNDVFMQLANKYDTHPKVRLHNVACSTENARVNFYPQTWGAKTGSSLVFGKDSTDKAPILVKAIDLAEWIKSNISKENYNILKLDLEGAEYFVLPHLFKNNIEEYIDEYFVEFHKKSKCPIADTNVVQDFYNRNLNWFNWDATIEEFNETYLPYLQKRLFTK